MAAMSTVPNSSPATPASASIGDDIRKAPLSWKIAAVAGVVGWFFKLGGGTKRTVNGVVTECSGLELGPIIAAGIVVVALLAGWRQIRSRHIALRPSPRFAAIVTGVLAADAVALTLRAVIDPGGSYC